MKRAAPRFLRKGQAVYDKWAQMRDKYKIIIDNNEATGRTNVAWIYLSHMVHDRLRVDAVPLRKTP